MILKLLNWQGMAGFAASLALAILLMVQKGETHHWKKASAGFEQLYRQEQSALATTVANTRAAADQARAADHANLIRVATDQRAINERTEHDFDARLIAARAAAQRLRVQPQTGADSRAGGSPPMPGVPDAASRPAQAAGEDRLRDPDALTATEQAIQLDELIKWIKAQAAVLPNSEPEPQKQPRARCGW